MNGSLSAVHEPSQGAAAETELERVTPKRLRWLYEALLGRCVAQLELGDTEYVDRALADARAAIALSPIAGGGWYRLRDAAKAGRIAPHTSGQWTWGAGDRPLAEIPAVFRVLTGQQMPPAAAP